MRILLLFLAALSVSLILAEDRSRQEETTIPDLKMPDNGLTFKMIEGYEEYKIVATHFRSDKEELRYVLANPLGYDALKKGVESLPEGSKIVKIGWSVRAMSDFPAALEADELQRIEYIVKDPDRFDADGDHWGYARFVKTEDGFKSWDKGTKGCIHCHSVAKAHDFLFTEMQETF